MVQIKQQIANRNNYGSARSLSKIDYIVIHYTANDGDHDEGNGSYFQNNIVKASAHYFVDDDSITQSVPDDYTAWAVGGGKYNNNGGRLYGIATNYNSISIELCDTIRDGFVYPTEKTIQNALELTRKLMAEYNIPHENVIRHFDVNGKGCPAYWIEDTKWKDQFWNRIVMDQETKLYGSKMTKKKYEALRDCFVRKTPGGDKVKFSELDDVTKGKCYKNPDGYARFVKNKKFDRIRQYTGSQGNTWYQTAKGWWLPAIKNGEKRVKEVK